MHNHLLSKVFRFHYHSQKVIGSLGGYLIVNESPFKVGQRGTPSKWPFMAEMNGGGPPETSVLG